MANRVIAAEDLGLTSDCDQAVPFYSGEAAYLLARKGRPIPREHEHLVTVKGRLKKEQKPAATKEQKPSADKAKGE